MATWQPLLFGAALDLQQQNEGLDFLWLSVDKQAIDGEQETLNSDYSSFVTPGGLRTMSLNRHKYSQQLNCACWSDIKTQQHHSSGEFMLQRTLARRWDLTREKLTGTVSHGNFSMSSVHCETPPLSSLPADAVSAGRAFLRFHLSPSAIVPPTLVPPPPLYWLFH